MLHCHIFFIGGISIGGSPRLLPPLPPPPPPRLATPMLPGRAVVRESEVWEHKIRVEGIKSERVLLIKARFVSCKVSVILFKKLVLKLLLLVQMHHLFLQCGIKTSSFSADCLDTNTMFLQDVYLSKLKTIQEGIFSYILKALLLSSKTRKFFG